MRSIKTYWNKVSLRKKFGFIYISVLFASLYLTLAILFKLNAIYMQNEINEAGYQTVSALKGNLSFIFENVTQFSNSIYFDNDIQSELKKVNRKAIDPAKQKKITKSLVNMILSGDYISGVYIIDRYNNVYSSYKMAPKGFYTDKIRHTKWYRNMRQANGNGFFIHKSEGVIEYRGDNDYITYVREIGDRDTYETIATLLVTINTSTIQTYFNKVSDKYGSQFFIVDANNNYIVKPQNNERVIKDYLDMKNSLTKEYDLFSKETQSFLFINQDLDIQDWKLVGAFKLDNIQKLAPYYTTIIIVIICINMMSMFACSILLTRLIFKPLSKVEKHMQLIEEGRFIEMPLDNTENEITRLKVVFNHMIKSIQDLIQKVKEEEKIVAKSELDIIQAQINPHFLYNTLDAVSALALMQDYENCFQITQALGDFYRNSLNSGLDFISIKEEINCIKSYITILNIRYEGKINVIYDVEEHLLEQKILKLILQPAVENAVHHGIKGNGGSGTIWIKIFDDEDEIICMIMDNGIGMTEQRIDEIMEGKTITGKSGFGVHSLMQRISLYYSIQEPIIIHSEIGSGTEVSIRIKKQILEN